MPVSERRAMPAICAVIFDLDDTLYPERAYAFSGFAAVATAFADRLGDARTTAAQMRRLFDTEHRGRVFNALLAERGLPEDEGLIRDMIEAYRTHAPGIALYRDADAALTRLRGGHKLGLLTDGPPGTQRAKIDALHLPPRVDEVIVTSELGTGQAKPALLPFTMMSQRLGVEPARCTYVADNPAKDFVAPNALGWSSVQVVREDGIYRTLAPAAGGRPGHVLDTLDALDAALP
jgi:putative hydrolase of the HAD superfamily